MYLLSTQYVVTLVKKLSKIPILIGTMEVMMRARVIKKADTYTQNKNI